MTGNSARDANPAWNPCGIAFEVFTKQRLKMTFLAADGETIHCEHGDGGERQKPDIGPAQGKAQHQNSVADVNRIAAESERAVVHKFARCTMRQNVGVGAIHGEHGGEVEGEASNEHNAAEPMDRGGLQDGVEG